MPNVVRKVGKKYRVFDKNTGKPTKNAAGTAVDGGGHATHAKALAQAEAISIHQHGGK